MNFRTLAEYRPSKRGLRYLCPRVPNALLNVMDVSQHSHKNMNNRLIIFRLKLLERGSNIFEQFKDKVCEFVLFRHTVYAALLTCPCGHWERRGPKFLKFWWTSVHYQNIALQKEGSDTCALAFQTLYSMSWTFPSTHTKTWEIIGLNRDKVKVSANIGKVKVNKNYVRFCPLPAQSLRCSADMPVRSLGEAGP